MPRLWLATSLIAIGVAALIFAPMAQRCVTDADNRLCETGGTILLNIAAAILVVAGSIWAGLLWRHRFEAS